MAACHEFERLPICASCSGASASRSCAGQRSSTGHAFHALVLASCMPGRTRQYMFLPESVYKIRQNVFSCAQYLSSALTRHVAGGGDSISPVCEYWQFVSNSCHRIIGRKGSGDEGGGTTAFLGFTLSREVIPCSVYFLHPWFISSTPGVFPLAKVKIECARRCPFSTPTLFCRRIIETDVGSVGLRNVHPKFA